MIGRLVVLLLAANLAWFAWSQGWLRGVGMGPTVQTEPERLERQVRPEALEVKPLPGAPSTSGGSTAPAPVASAPAAAPPPAVSGAPASTEPPSAPVTAAATRATAVLGDVGGQSASARRRNASRVASDAWLTAACGTNMSKPWNPPPHMWRSTLTPAWLSRVA